MTYRGMEVADGQAAGLAWGALVGAMPRAMRVLPLQGCMATSHSRTAQSSGKSSTARSRYFPSKSRAYTNTARLANVYTRFEIYNLREQLHASYSSIPCAMRGFEAEHAYRLCHEKVGFHARETAPKERSTLHERLDSARKPRKC